MLTLFEFGLSGNCHKARLLLSMLGLSYTKHTVNGGLAEHKSADYLQQHPMGQVPLLVDADIRIWDSQAILVYLAAKRPEFGFYPAEPKLQAQIQSWLSVANNELNRGPAQLRMHYKFGRVIDLNAAQTTATQLLLVLEKKLQQGTWLVGTQVTIADIAMYPYLALAHEAQLDLAAYPAITRWLRDFESLPGYVAMPGIQPSYNQVSA
jgi:glutathione S-transferase